MSTPDTRESESTVSLEDEPFQQPWRSGRWGVCLVVLYMLLAALPLILTYALGAGGGGSFPAVLGKSAGLMGFSLLALQVALSARLKPVDGPFGLDVVMHFHKSMAMLAGVLLLSHPLLLAVGGHGWGLFSLWTPWYITMGKVTLALVVLVIALAVSFKKLGIEYQLWRYAHKGAILVVVFGFVHILWVGAGLPTAAKVCLWALFAMAVGLFAYRNLYVAFLGRQQYEVTDVSQESHDTWTLSLQPTDGEVPANLPGQFMFLRLDRPGRPSEEHPFTISSRPGQDHLTATIKESGDFTNTIGETRAGDGARIEAPYGRFSFAFHRPDAFLFIAGGVGITPIHSMLDHLRRTGDERPVVLIYGNKRREDILFREELEKLPRNMKVVHVLSQAGEDWDGYRGFITEDIIEQEAGHVLDDAHVYLCGPPPMMDMV
ncbi:MAG: FAD-binding oxidoreductase, partial [Planctomycetota bacterium]